MKCNCTCKRCERKFDRYSGYLLNISDSLINELKEKIISEGHTVLCSTCIENILNVGVVKFRDLKWKHVNGYRYWYTSNYIYYLRRLGKVYSKSEDRVKNISEDDLKEIVDIIESIDSKGVILKYPFNYLWSEHAHYPIDIRELIR